MGLITLGLGIFHHRFSEFRRRLRYVEIDQAGLSYRLGPFRHAALKWSEISSVSVKDDEVMIYRSSGPNHLLNLRRFSNRDEVRTAIAEQASAAGRMQVSAPSSTGTT